MRVIFDGPLLNETPTGTGVHLQQLVRHLRKLQPELSLCSYHCGRRQRQAHIASVQHFDADIDCVTVDFPATLMRPLQRWTKLPRQRWLSGQFDIYHQLHTDADPAVPGSQLVVTMHDTVALEWPAEEGEMYPGAAHLLRRAAAVVTVSQFSKSQIVRRFGVSPDSVRVCGNGVDRSRFRADISSSARRAVYSRYGITGPYLLYVGGYTPRKNLSRLLLAVAEAADGSDLRLVVAGPAGDVARSPVAVLAERSGIADRVDMIGYVRGEDLPAVYAEAEALVYPSVYEGFGLPVLEALACGTEVVTSCVSALPEVAGDVAVLVDPSDVNAIAAGIRKALGTTADRQRVARHLRQFSWRRVASEVLGVYADVHRSASAG